MEGLPKLLQYRTIDIKATEIRALFIEQVGEFLTNYMNHNHLQTDDLRELEHTKALIRKLLLSENKPDFWRERHGQNPIKILLDYKDSKGRVSELFHDHNAVNY